MRKVKVFENKKNLGRVSGRFCTSENFFSTITKRILDQPIPSETLSGVSQFNCTPNNHKRE